MINKYKFLPVKPDELDLTKGVVFGRGSFINADEKEIAVDLTIFNDGFVADTRSSTNESDAFLDEFISWIAMEYQLIPYQEVIRSKTYLSELWVKTDKHLNTLNPKLEQFGKHLTSMIKGHNHHPIEFETTGISFWTNPTITLPPGPFRFERGIDTPFGENRYFSIAPLQTDAHLELLDELEKILSN